MSNIQVVCPHCLKLNRLPYKDHYNKAICGHCKASLLDNRPIEANGETFDWILQKSDLPVIVDFWAPWCGPCQMMAPNFAQSASQLPLKAEFVKLNTQDNPSIANRYGIRSIPTMIIFKGGREVDRISGALSSEQIVEWLSRFL